MAGGNSASIARAVYSHRDIHEKLLHKFMGDLESECSSICKRALPGTGKPSLFRKIPVKDMPTFSWSDCVNKLESTAPLLLRLMLLIVSHSNHRNKDKRCERHYPGMCMAIATLLKERNREMSGVQTLSLFLRMFRNRFVTHPYFDNTGIANTLGSMLKVMHISAGVHKAQPCRSAFKLHRYPCSCK